MAERSIMKRQAGAILPTCILIPLLVLSCGLFKKQEDGIRFDSFPGSCGLKNGDVATEVNGVKLTSLENMLEMYEQIRKDGKAVIKVDRKGTPVEIVIGTE